MGGGTAGFARQTRRPPRARRGRPAAAAARRRPPRAVAVDCRTHRRLQRRARPLRAAAGNAGRTRQRVAGSTRPAPGPARRAASQPTGLCAAGRAVHAPAPEAGASTTRRPAAGRDRTDGRGAVAAVATVAAKRARSRLAHADRAAGARLDLRLQQRCRARRDGAALGRHRPAAECAACGGQRRGGDDGAVPPPCAQCGRGAGRVRRRQPLHAVQPAAAAARRLVHRQPVSARRRTGCAAHHRGRRQHLAVRGAGGA